MHGLMNIKFVKTLKYMFVLMNLLVTMAIFEWAFVANKKVCNFHSNINRIKEPQWLSQCSDHAKG